MALSAIEELIEKVKCIDPVTKISDENHIVMDNNPDKLMGYVDSTAHYCGVDQLSNMFSWKKGFSYLFTGSPNTGKSTVTLYMMLLMAIRFEWNWCVWSPEMEDAQKINGKIVHHMKDLIYTLIWTLIGKTPYEHYARKYQCQLMTNEEIYQAIETVNNHFVFPHLKNRTPSGIIEAFDSVNQSKEMDGFLIDPWKSVKQDMGGKRSDLWLEDVLMSFREFSLETNSVMSYIVHPKSMQDYRDEQGQYRVITPFDLNGGAAWNNSMDIIVSLRRIIDIESSSSRMEWHSQKIRKQHLVGKPGSYERMDFDMNKYRFTFEDIDPITVS